MIASSLFLFFLIPHLYSYFALANLWTLTSTFITVTIISTCYAILSHQATQKRVKKRMLWLHTALLLLCLGLILGITTCEHSIRHDFRQIFSLFLVMLKNTENFPALTRKISLLRELLKNYRKLSTSLPPTDQLF